MSHINQKSTRSLRFRKPANLVADAFVFSGLALSVKSYGFASSPKGRAFGIAARFPVAPELSCPKVTPSVIAYGDATFPKGTAFCGDSKVSGIA